MTIPDLLHASLKADASRPLITFYDEQSGERTELSIATTENWVAKTGNMLQDSLGADSSTTVRLGLPPHWETCVWLLACWAVGCTVASDSETTADVAVVGPGGWEEEDADEVVALSLRPLGGRFTEPLPAGVLDYNAEVLGHGDHFTAIEPPTGATTAMRHDVNEVSHDRLIAQSRSRAPEGARILFPDGGTHPVDALATALVTALAVRGSLVVVRDPSGTGIGDERRAALARSEQVTAELG